MKIRHGKSLILCLLGMGEVGMHLGMVSQAAVSWNHKICCEATTHLWDIKIQTEENISFFGNLNCARKPGIGSWDTYLKLSLHYNFLHCFLFNRLQRLLFPWSKILCDQGFQPLPLLSSWRPPCCSPHSLRHNVYFSTMCCNQWFSGRVGLKISSRKILSH